MKRTTKTVAIAAGVLIVGLAAGMLLAQGRSETLATTQAPAQTASAQALPVTSTASLQSLQLSFRQVAQRIIPSVVEINVTEMVNQPTQDFNFPFPFPSPFGQQPQGGSQRVPVSALGSGIIVQRTGNRYFVLTNNHVVESATQVSVRLNDQRTYKATVLGKDPLKDLAMVAFDTSDSIPVAALGDSNSLQVGDIVLAVGNPFGYTDTVTMGIVSALGRHGPPGQQPSTYTSYIQTDAAINQGNSGGALVNVDGEVVGINTWIAAPNGGNIGLGFAIPIDTAKTDVQQLATKGQVQYGWMGVEISDIQDSSTYPGYASDLKLQGVKGAMVMDVYKGSPAAEAGVLPGDYVTAVDSTPVQNADQLTQVVGNLIAGRTYTFSVLRDGNRTDLRVKIGVRNEAGLTSQYKNLWPGMTVVDITDQVRQQLSLPRDVNGVVVGYVSDQSTPAAIAGLQVGDVITAINGSTVTNIREYYQALNDLSHRTVTFSLVRQETDVTVGLMR